MGAGNLRQEQSSPVLAEVLQERHNGWTPKELIVLNHPFL
jgi:hypothetical protein